MLKIGIGTAEGEGISLAKIVFFGINSMELYTHE